MFSVSPSSGTIVADTTTTFTLTATMPSASMPGTEVVGDLRITSDALAVDHVVNLHAAPRGAVLSFTPASANFGDVELGLSGSRVLTVENSGNAPANITIADPSDAEFAVAFVDGRVLANGASRQATVTYTPTEDGADTATASETGPATSPLSRSRVTSPDPSRRVMSVSAQLLVDDVTRLCGNLPVAASADGTMERASE